MNPRNILLVKSILIFLICLSHSCIKKYSDSGKNTQSSIFKDIPTNNKGEPVLSYLMDMQKIRALNLDTLGLGFDSIQVRIWLTYGQLRKENLIILKNDKKKWSGQFYDLLIDHAVNEEPVILEKKIEGISPKSGWPNFIKKLFDLDLMDLPSWENISGYGLGLHEDSYSVEIATKNRYRYYDYVRPADRANEFPEAKKMESILQLLEEEFNFKRPI
jgi:hypothetical protein